MSCLLAHSARLPVVGFDSTTASTVYLREGESAEICVVLESGRTQFEFTVQALINRKFEIPRGSSEYNNNYYN